MYECDCCHKTTEQLPSISIPHSEISPTAYEVGVITQCPCGGQFFEVARCDRCGELFEKSTLRSGVCDACCKQFEHPEIILSYINSAVDRECDFYVGAQFDFWISDATKAPPVLVEMCKRRFYECRHYTTAGAFYTSAQNALLQEFISFDKAHFHEWCIENKMEGRLNE